MALTGEVCNRAEGRRVFSTSASSEGRTDTVPSASHSASGTIARAGRATAGRMRCQGATPRGRWNAARWLLSATVVLFAAMAHAAPVRVLILSGANNHNWRATTPVLKDTLERTGRFHVAVETNVADLTASAFAAVDVVLSNFNTFNAKDAGAVWSPDVRQAFIEFVRRGKGLVTVHAGSSVFYDWPEFQQLAGAAWGKGTGHGQMHTNEVRVVDRAHPVTSTLSGFSTFDEFWQGVPLAEGAHVLAETTPAKDSGGSGKPEPVALVTRFGQGRAFTLLLGHDVRAMGSEGFQSLLRRGVEWAATGAVKE